MSKWAWARFLLNLNNSRHVSKIEIITFNYDIWLERTLDLLGIDYEVAPFQSKPNTKFTILKPHGSISFLHLTDPYTNFNISYRTTPLDAKISDFEIAMTGMDQHKLVVPLIPPAGDSERLYASWSKELREQCQKRSEATSPNDRVLICGLSYWHVDRREIDQILLAVPEGSSVAYINPSPPRVFDAVLTSLFTNYELYSDMNHYMECNDDV